MGAATGNGHRGGRQKGVGGRERRSLRGDSVGHWLTEDTSLATLARSARAPPGAVVAHLVHLEHETLGLHDVEVDLAHQV